MTEQYQDRPMFSREFIHAHLTSRALCYFESREAAIPMADKLNLKVANYHIWYYIMPRDYNPHTERNSGNPFAWFCYVPKGYK